MTNMATSEPKSSTVDVHGWLTDQPTDGTTLREPEIPAFLGWLGKTFLRLFGWHLTGQVPDVAKLVAIGAPHTSNFDGIFMLATMWAFRQRGRFVIKIEWLRGPVGWLLKLFGGVGVDRDKSRNFVGQSITVIEREPRILLLIAPEGTRRKAEYWKSGFYWIAHGAGVPILLTFMDHKHKRIGVGPLLYPSGDIMADMEIMRAFYSQMSGRFPEKMSEIRVRPHNARE